MFSHYLYKTKGIWNAISSHSNFNSFQKHVWKIMERAKPYQATLHCLLKKNGSGLLKTLPRFQAYSQDHYRIVPTLYWFMSIVNANIQVSYCRWKLVKHLDCFGDKRRIKDARKIKFCSLKPCCVTLLSYSISHNFRALKSWKEKSEENLKKSWWSK